MKTIFFIAALLFITFITANSHSLKSRDQLQNINQRRFHHRNIFSSNSKDIFLNGMNNQVLANEVVGGDISYDITYDNNQVVSGTETDQVVTYDNGQLSLDTITQNLA